MRLFAFCAAILAWMITPAEARRGTIAPWQEQHWWSHGYQPYHQVSKKERRARSAHKTQQKRARKRVQMHTSLRSRGLVTVPTAAGIKITVSPSFAPKITAFIADLVGSGYKPRRISCFARSGHVHGSRHYSGNACDFDQRAWGKTARPMYRVAGLAKKHGLRDGGSFSDYGHIDDGRPLARFAGRRAPRVGRLKINASRTIAEAQPFVWREAYRFP